MYFSIEDILDKKQIQERAAMRWDSFTPIERLRESKKYAHITARGNAGWVLEFNSLDSPKQNILIKGELIRTYDKMLMSDKKKLTNEAHLSKFETKWVKFSSSDKEKMLAYVLKRETNFII